MRMWRVLGLALVGSLGGIGGMARADLVTYNFSGTDSSNNAAVTGTLTYNSPGTFISTSNNNGTQLNNFGTTGSLSVTEGGTTWSSTSTLNVSLSGSDVSFLNTSPWTATNPEMSLEIKQSSGSNPLFSSITALPTTLSLTNATGSFQVVTFDGTNVTINGTFTSLTSGGGSPPPPPAKAPEPGTLALAGTGLATLVAAMRRRLVG